jgi:hypothetical protein
MQRSRPDRNEGEQLADTNVSAAQRIKEETEQILCDASKVITMAGRGVLSTPRRDNYRTITRIAYRSPRRANPKIDPLANVRGPRTTVLTMVMHKVLHKSQSAFFSIGGSPLVIQKH